MTDRRKTFEDADPKQHDVVLCHYCGESLHDPEHDVFWKDTVGHYCPPMARAEVAELREVLRAVLTSLQAYRERGKRIPYNVAMDANRAEEKATELLDR